MGESKKLNRVLTSSIKSTMVCLAVIMALIPDNRVFADAQQKPVVRIAFVLPLSGDWAFLGNGIRDAALLAAEDLDNHRFEYQLLFEDNRGELKDSVTTAKRLIGTEAVDAFVSIISGVGELLNPLAEKAGVLNVGICSNTDVANGKYNFVNYLTAEQGVGKFLREMKTRYPGGANLAVFSLNEAGFNFIVEDLKSRHQEFGIDLSSIETFEPKTTDFRSQIVKVFRKPLDAVLILGISPEIENLGRQLRELGKEVPLVSIEGFGLAENKEVFEGSWFVDAAVPNEEFRSRFSKTYQREITAGVGHSYDTVMMIARAFELAAEGNSKPSREKVAEALQSLRGYRGVLGEVSVASSGIVGTDPSIKVIRGGRVKLAS